MTPPALPPSLPRTLPEAHRRLLGQLVQRLSADPRFVGVAIGGSFVSDSMDAFSDLDLVIAVEPEHLGTVLAERQRTAAGLGTLLAAFTGEHVGEPRMLICLFADPLLHVDLKFVALPDAAERIEDPAILWEREGRLTAALAARPPVYPLPDRQWIEDRFWISGALCRRQDRARRAVRGHRLPRVPAPARARSARGAERAGLRPGGCAGFKATAPDLGGELRATLAGHDAADCLRALAGLRRPLPSLRAGTRPQPRDRGGAGGAGLARRRRRADDAGLLLVCAAKGDRMRATWLLACLLGLSLGVARRRLSRPAPTRAPPPRRRPPQVNLTPPAGLPPLIDRELFFDDPEISGGQISPDGKFISFRKPYKGVANIWVKRRRGALRCRPPGDRRHQAAGQRLLLERGRQTHPLRPGQGRRRELPHLRRRPRRQARGEHRGAAGARPHAVPGRAGDDPRPARVDARARCWWGSTTATRSCTTCTGWRSPPASARCSSRTTQNVAGWDFDLKGRLRLAARADRRRRHGDPARRRQEADQRLHLQRRGDLRPRPLSQGRPPRLHDQQQGRRRT